MSGSQLESLTAFFRENVPARAQVRFDSVAEDMRVVPAARDLGEKQYQQGVIRYSGLLSWERFPYRLVSPQLLVSLLAAWMDDNESDVMDSIGITDADPEWDVTVEDEETATVVLSIPLAEALVIRQDDNGPIPWNGERWTLATPEIWTALSASVFSTADETGAPVGELDV